ncbi:MAG: hypothetical protein HY398_02625 [Candidatus Doudnabacteria bacterium]|nr:hypothetical protein [Candidatus Doudnabacteria bacterium]
MANFGNFSLSPIYDIYNQFLSYFPENVHWVISLALALLLVLGVYKVLRKQFVYLVLLVVLLPASVPILKNIWSQLLELLRFLISRK